MIVAFSLLSSYADSQEKNDAEQVVTNLFVATDLKDWDRVESCFSSTVQLDYSSLNGSPAVKLTPQEITSSWKSILPGFTYTHHQLGNLISSVKGKNANVFCYGTASHYLEDQKGNIWTVVGSYDFELISEDGAWKITSMIFHFKYQDGNTSLAQRAMQILK